MDRAYVLDANQAKAVVIDGKGFQDLIFVQSPAPYGLPVWAGDVNTQPRLAWATQNMGGDQYPQPDDITVMLRVVGGEWYNSKLFCP